MFINPGNPMAELFDTDKPLIGMVHVLALPGTPYASKSMPDIVRHAVDEAKTLAGAGFDGLIIENMHDRPYLLKEAGPEVVAAMTCVVQEVRQAVELPLGVQILAGANQAALAVAAVAGGCFIRAENFIFAHVADEGLMPTADAGPLLRYRRAIGAEHVRIWADVKKKHAAHALTADVDIAHTALAAAFSGADAVIVTGPSTGCPAERNDLREASAAVELPIVVGSGVEPGNLADLWDCCDAFIVGSSLKKDGLWHRPLDPDRIAVFIAAVDRCRS